MLYLYLNVNIEDSKQQEKNKVIRIWSQFGSGIRREQHIIHSSVITMCTESFVVNRNANNIRFGPRWAFIKMCFMHEYIEYSYLLEVRMHAYYKK